MTDRPIFQGIFGPDWGRIPVVFKKHYANRPYSHDRIAATGEMDILSRDPIRLFAWLFQKLGSLPAVTEKNVPVTVTYNSDIDTDHFHLRRVFHLAGRDPYIFQSVMIPSRGNMLTEISPPGIGWRMSYHWQDGKIVLKHIGYVLAVFGRLVPFPLEALIGRGYAEEIAVEDEHFEMVMRLVHPLWGCIYEYKGRFKMNGMLL